MPLDMDEGYTIHRAVFHPPIYEQRGRFFYKDGVQLTVRRVGEVLDYLQQVADRFGVKHNPVKAKRKLWYERRWSEQITTDV